MPLCQFNAVPFATSTSNTHHSRLARGIPPVGLKTAIMVRAHLSGKRCASPQYFAAP
jgi:hypothetical protein